MNDIRFIHTHLQSEFPRMTIAYRRTEDFLYWAVARVNPNDEYVKKIGAEISKSRLMEVFSKAPDKEEWDFDWGVSNFTDFIEYYGFDTMLSDQQRIKMDFYSFKHAFLSDFILHQIQV